MLTIPLARLEQQGTLEIRGAIPAEDPAWDGSGFVFSTDLTVAGQAQWVSSGEVVVRVRVHGKLEQECRLCLDPVKTRIDEEVTLVYAPAGEGGGPDEAEFRPLPAKTGELELKYAIREEIILSQTAFVQCRPDCRGLCPRCGVNLNEEKCECTEESADPRWDALRALRDR